MCSLKNLKNSEILICQKNVVTYFSVGHMKTRNHLHHCMVNIFIATFHQKHNCKTLLTNYTYIYSRYNEIKHYNFKTGRSINGMDIGHFTQVSFLMWF